MSDFVYRLAYVVLCCAGMLAFWFLVKYGIESLNPLFASGLGVGLMVGVTGMALANAYDKRNAQRGGSPKD